MEYIHRRVDLKGKRVLDVGCGGGILSEALALAGAQVIGIDAAKGPLKVAKLHSHETGIFPDYRNTTIEQPLSKMRIYLMSSHGLEMLEHVPNPESVISSCFKLLKPNGNAFSRPLIEVLNPIFSQLSGQNTCLSFCPKGTHQYEKLIKPSELALVQKE